MLIHHAAAHGVRLHEVKSTLAGDLDIQGPGISENARNGYKKNQSHLQSQVKRTKRENKRTRMLAQKGSPVFDIIHPPTPVARIIEASTKIGT